MPKGNKKKGENPNYTKRAQPKTAAGRAIAAASPSTALVAVTPEESARLRLDVFCLEYIQDFNCVRAYRAATGSDYKSIYTDAYEYARRPEVKARLAEITAEKMERLNINADRIIAEYGKLAFFNPRNYTSLDEFNQPYLDMEKIINDPEAMGCLDVEFGIAVTKDGDRVKTYKIKSKDKYPALEALIKINNLAKGVDPNANKRPIHVTFAIPEPGSNWRNAQRDIVDADYAEEAEG